MALWIARSLDEPWEMMHTPSTPSSIAPPYASGSSVVYSGSSAGISASACALYSGVDAERPEQPGDHRLHPTLERLQHDVAR